MNVEQVLTLGNSNVSCTQKHIESTQNKTSEQSSEGETVMSTLGRKLPTILF